MLRKRILFIPADSLPPGLTRSYWLAKGLSKYHEVFLLHWIDPRADAWSISKYPFFNSPVAFIKSLFTSIRVIAYSPDKEESFKILRAPVMLNAFINHIFGDLKARKICRWFNKRILSLLVKRLSPDVIFYADGFYYFPVTKKKVMRIYVDIQDDFDERNGELLEREVAYGSSCFSLCTRAYAVSPAAAERFSKLYGRQFKWLPNGADFKRFTNVLPKDVQFLKGKLNLHNRLVISYIGGSVWFDDNFITQLSKKLIHEIPEAVILLVGNLPTIKAENVVSVGFINPEDIHQYFLISDMGMHLKDSMSSKFLYHSIPLKIIQYSAAKKPFISTPIKWLEENKFPNIRMLPLNVNLWIAEIRELKTFTWSKEWDVVWEKYDWSTIGSMLAEEIGT